MDELATAALELTAQAEAETPVTVEALDQKLLLMLELRQAIDAKKTETERLNKDFELLKAEVQKLLESLGRTSYQLPEVGTASKVVDNSYKMPQALGDKEHLFDYIEKKYGRDTLLGYLSIHHASLNAFISEEKANGSYMIPGVGTPSINEYVRFTPARKR